MYSSTTICSLVCFHQLFFFVLQITRGANGIGRAIGIELAKCGCNIAIADVDVEGSLDTVDELQLLGVKAFSYEVNIVFVPSSRRSEKLLYIFFQIPSRCGKLR